MVAKAQKIKRPAVAYYVQEAAQSRPGSRGVEETARVLQSLGVGTLAEILDRPEAPYRWIGAASPGAAAPCSADSVKEALEDHTLPDGSSIGGSRGGSQNSWGIVLSDPKTCSLLIAHPDDRVRLALEAAHEARAEAFLRALEQLATCRTRDGEELFTTPVVGLCGATVTHNSSSYGDPTRHTHILLSNMGLCEDGKWRSLNTEAMIPLIRICEAQSLQVYKKSLSDSLGLTESDWTYTDAGSLKVPELKALKAHVEDMSQAKAHVAECAAKLGMALDSRTLEQDAFAYRKHRAERGQLSEAIEHAVDAAYATDSGRAALRQFWHERSPGLRQALEKVKPREPGLDLEPEAPLSKEEERAAWAGTMERAFAWAQEQSVWSWADITAQLESDPIAPMPMDRAAVMAARLIDRYGETGQIVASAPMEPAVKAMLKRESVSADELRLAIKTTSICTTAAALEREHELRSLAERLANAKRQPLPVSVPENATNEQREAIKLMASGRALVTVEGVAGAGKSHTVGVAAEAARAAGVKVICTARNAATAADIGASIGVTKLAETPSVASLLLKEDLPEGPLMIVVDEGGVIDRSNWEELLRRAEARDDVQIIALGDRGQAQMIDRSGAWHVVTEGTSTAGKNTVLSQSWRCQAWEEQHNALRNGQTDIFCAEAEKTGGFLPSSETEWATQAAAIIHEKPGVLGLTMSNDEAAEISRQVQKLRGIEGVLPCSGDGYIGIGDVVRTRRNDRRARVFNGNVWVVEKISKDGQTVSLKSDTGRRVSLAADYVKDYVELNYASTLDSAQGRTVDQALVLCREGMGQSGFYSALTRGKAAPLMLCVTDLPDPSLARFESKRVEWEAERMTAAQKIVRGIMEADDVAPTVKEYADKIRADFEKNWQVFSDEFTAERETAFKTPSKTPVEASKPEFAEVMPLEISAPEKPKNPEPAEKRQKTAVRGMDFLREKLAEHAKAQPKSEAKRPQRHTPPPTPPADEPPPWEPDDADLAPSPEPEAEEWRPSL